MIAALPRTVISITGEGVADWLDGLITNSVPRDGRTAFAALLTPQGKIIADMVLTPTADGVRLDTPDAMADDLLKRLRMYVLRAPITVAVEEGMTIHAVWNADEDMPGAQDDPRHASLGQRVIAPALPTDATIEDYDAHRLSLGVPDSLFDFGSAEIFPHDAAMDELNGIDLKKGCFVGQEVVSRMARLGTVRKRIRAVVLSGAAEAGDTVQSGTRRVGDILHVQGAMASALVRLDRMEAATEGYTVNGAPAEIMGGPTGN